MNINTNYFTRSEKYIIGGFISSSILGTLSAISGLVINGKFNKKIASIAQTMLACICNCEDCIPQHGPCHRLNVTQIQNYCKSLNNEQNDVNSYKTISADTFAAVTVIFIIITVGLCTAFLTVFVHRKCGGRNPQRQPLLPQTRPTINDGMRVRG